MLLIDFGCHWAGTNVNQDENSSLLPSKLNKISGSSKLKKSWIAPRVQNSTLQTFEEYLKWCNNQNLRPIRFKFNCYLLVISRWFGLSLSWGQCQSRSKSSGWTRAALPIPQWSMIAELESSTTGHFCWKERISTCSFIWSLLSLDQVSLTIQ